ncbi:sulfatase-like hydrolase/transferase [Olivibacter ginsenosidimutans]|uniref:Sulfatase-like hydrolase/transferase n=1 Tax=Olivibacter ginsenosidimutans TaxID=1176537 RepID=A0ABP9B899_9SPHI
MRLNNTLTIVSLLFFIVIGSKVKAQHAELSNTSLHPNIVLIIVDQFRADASKREGFELNTTPFLDSLAVNGTWFNRAYCAMPACVPSRTSMLTGRFPSATRVSSNMNLKDAYFTKNLFEIVKANGYQTALVGKNHTFLEPKDVDYWKDFNHLGSAEPQTQEEKDFNQFLHSTHFYMSEKPTPFSVHLQMPAQIVKSAEHWVDQVAGKASPFFMMVSIPEPHNPYQAPEPYYSLFPPESLPPVTTGKEVLPKKGNTWMLEKQLLEMGYGDYEKMIPRIRSNYYGMMRLIDDQIKELVHHFKAKGLADNTIFLFVSDHGDYVGEYGLIKKGVGVPECLTRIPMIWYGPQISKNKLPSDAHVSNIDIMPTICDLLGVELPDGVQGRSLWPLLQGKDYPKEEFASMVAQQGYGGLHFVDFKEYDPYEDDGTVTKGAIECDELNTWTQSGRMRMLRKGDWKLVYDMQGHGELYNLVNDPAEVNDLYEDKNYSIIKTGLLEDLLAWELRAQDPLPLPHPNKVRKYGFKTDKRNYWAPHKNEAKEHLEKIKK